MKNATDSHKARRFSSRTRSIPVSDSAMTQSVATVTADATGNTHSPARAIPTGQVTPVPTRV
ncbi:hypothetical protein GCM10027168_35560 [Streptomyces capparidis]